MNESMPVIIHYSHGACHAEWGRTDSWIESEGVSLYESGSGNLIDFEDGQRYENEDFRAVEPLIQALQDNYNVVRYSAAVSLGKIKDRRSEGPLRQALNDSDGDIREAARRAINALESSRQRKLEKSSLHNNYILNGTNLYK